MDKLKSEKPDDISAVADGATVKDEISNTDSLHEKELQHIESTTSKPDSPLPISNNFNKVKPQQQQQSHQFRAPQQFVNKKKSTTVLAKKNKAWNKRQNKSVKQQQIISAPCTVTEVSGGTLIAGVTGSVGNLPTTSADLENIQNLKNQISGQQYYQGGANKMCGISGNGSEVMKSPISSTSSRLSSLAGLEKSGYGYSYPKQALYKKLLLHRGNQHVLCTGSAHNTLGASVSTTWCLVNGGCKDAASICVNTQANSSVTVTSNPSNFSCGRSKFFLSDKRPRQEIIVPPTKFLLGGNISDPLNLNSLQNETSSTFSNTNTQVIKPRQPPITTPPKVEVIIPPNIHDPLHLLDPVDSMEYEKQLTSPMKRGLHGIIKSHKYRNRKSRKPKRRRNDSYNCSNATLELSEVSQLVNSTVSNEPSTSFSVLTNDINSLNQKLADAGKNDKEEAGLLLQSGETVSLTKNSNLPYKNFDAQNVDIAIANSSSSGQPLVINENASRRDLRLELNSSLNNLNGRKRKISENSNTHKNKKFHRQDFMDKIVSPVVPQPGAWKRPPRLIPSGARKPMRRSVSLSETETLNPVDESKVVQFEGEPSSYDEVKFDEPDKMRNKTIDEKPPSPEDKSSVDKLSDSAAVCITKSDATLLVPTLAKDKACTSSSIVAPNFRGDGTKYSFGNYDRYSNFRQLNEFTDVRLQVFHRHAELFQGKDILDIGCNVGHMTITVARNLAPKSILGVDIDKKLIACARRNLAMYVRIPPESRKNEFIKTKDTTTNAASTMANSKKRKKVNVTSTCALLDYGQNNQALNLNAENPLILEADKNIVYQRKQLVVKSTEFFPVSFPITYNGIPMLVPYSEYNSPGPTSTPGHNSTSSISLNAAELKNDFPKNVFFRQLNYVLKDDSLLCNDSQQYDLIMCLSTTKWIHLNFGDVGLKRAFRRMFNQLRPGGKLILEAQNWASYKKKKNLTEEIKKNFGSIEFFPNKFHEYLLSTEVGFSHSYTLGVPRHLNKGFCRPIQLYAKGDYTPNHVRWSDAYYPQTPSEVYRGIYATMPSRPPSIAYRMSSTRSQTYDTPHYTGGNSGSYSCQQTPMHKPTSQYYNPLETDSYQPSYDMEYLNHKYVFASPLYQTVWSPPASMRNSSSHTHHFSSVCDAELDGYGSSGGGGSSYHRHVYPPNDETSSPNASTGGAFSSIRDTDTDDSNQQPATAMHHVYATNCSRSSLSPQVHQNDLENIEGFALSEDNATEEVTEI